MYHRYHVDTRDAPPVVPPVHKFAVRISKLGFLGMGLEILKDSRSVGELRAISGSRPCIYGVYDNPLGGLAADPSKCRGCMRCMVEHPEVATIETNPDYKALGDSYWKPEQVLTVAYEASTGRVPVRGAGYNGPFKGTGFDAIWTDMSEIVRPTRDGIHGREFISTVVDIGRKPARIEFERGRADFPATAWFEIPIPILFDGFPTTFVDRRALLALVAAARRAGTLCTIPPGETPVPGADPATVVPRLRASEIGSAAVPAGVRMVEVEHASPADIPRCREGLAPGVVLCARLHAEPGVEDLALSIVRAGADAIHVYADYHGCERGGPRFITEVIRAVHGKLLEAGLRNEVTVIAGGGIIQAEHVPKAILLGADLVASASAPLMALQGKIRGELVSPKGPRVDLPPFSDEWAEQRLVNLLGSWRDQLLEILGAMGMREVRRLRGDVGRAIFAEAMEAEIFEPVFGPPRRNPPATVARDNEPEPHSSRRRVALPHDREDMPAGEGLEGKIARRHAEHIREGYEKLAGLEYGVPEALGGYRWTNELILATWRQASTGEVPEGIEYRVGASGGGFDRMDFRFPVPVPGPGPAPAPEPDLSIELNRRADGPRITIPIPVYGAGFSYGSVGLSVMLARARAAKELGTFTSTGEGGYPPPLAEYKDHVITQIATGLFGVSEKTIRWARIVEFKYAQGAKPGLGGHLLGDKVTANVASLREAVPFVSLFSPFPFHSVYSVEDHKKHLDWVRAVNPDALLSVKVSTPTDVDMVAIGSYYAGANIVHLDGGYGGTGAAPEIAKKNIAMPIEYALPKVHRQLEAEGVRDEVVLMASGGIRTAYDVAKAIALGADGAIIGSAELVALGCTMCRNCELGRGCPFGLTTTDPELSQLVTEAWGARRITNLYRSGRAQWTEILRRLGLPSIRALRGRTDFLVHLDYGAERQAAVAGAAR
ncbi:MAG: alpha-hydroxy-acid oxidizing protein [Planctomycetes bacterium]|nr:alpha-hydroxy-acid oxidizing protein [Planctomycetota bacterium]